MPMLRDIFEMAAYVLSGRIVRSAGWADWYAEQAYRDDKLTWC